MIQDANALPARRILVIAPHPDDESLGCGGLIASLAHTGRCLSTIFVTDGGASHTHSRKWPRNRLVAEREREAIEALSRLGAARHPRHFLRMRDAERPDFFSEIWRQAVAHCADIVVGFEPDLVLAPWRRDPHCDHRSSWQLITDAIARAGVRPTMLEYAIWLDEFGKPEDAPRDEEVERIDFDVSGFLSNKLSAIAAHRTQTTALIDDDPTGFRLASSTIARLSGRYERYLRAVHASD